MRDLVIYEAGGMTGLTREEYMNWRSTFKSILTSLARQKGSKFHPVIINPAEYYNFHDNIKYDSEQEVLDFDLYKLRKSNIVICNYNAPQSLGTMAELAIAYDRKIPIIGINTLGVELHPWQQCMTHKMCNSIYDAAKYVEQYYLN